MKKTLKYSKVVFGNKIGKFTQQFALGYKKFYIRKFGDDSKVDYKIKFDSNFILKPLFNCQNIVPLEGRQKSFEIDDPKAVIIGNIRMGFGHYRIAMAMASAAKSLGYHPYWFDLSNFKDSLCTKMINYQNKLYSLASRISQKSSLFNKLFWDPISMNYYKRLEGHAIDQKNAEAFVPIFRHLPKDIPYIATHSFCSQGAVHAGLKNVVNAIPDNWPISIHLSEGSVQTVQTPSSYIGYKSLRGMNKRRKLKPLPAGSIFYAGHYVDHEIVKNINDDCNLRITRAKNKFDKRYLITVGGAGAQGKLIAKIIKHFLPLVKNGSASLFINVGDHKNVLDYLYKKVPELKSQAKEFNNQYDQMVEYINDNRDKKTKGVYLIYNEDIFQAVYSTNLLMRFVDCMLTKPSELAFYPVPKIIITRVGGHEMYGAIRTSELGDGTYECETKKEILAMIDHFHKDNSLLYNMCYHIVNNKKSGIYNGAYNVVKLATKHLEKANNK